MFKFLEAQARKSIRVACRIAQTYRYRYVGTEHLLYAVVRTDQRAVRRALESVKVDPQRVLETLERLFENQAGESADVLRPFTAHAKRAIEASRRFAEARGESLATCADLLLGTLAEPTGVAAQVARHFALDEQRLRRALEGVMAASAREDGEAEQDDDGANGAAPPPAAPMPPLKPGQPPPRGAAAKGKAGAAAKPGRTPALDAFGIDLTKRARDGALDIVTGREDELERLVQVLVRRGKNNPLLLGEPGTGKTAIVEGLAQRIAEGFVPAAIARARVVALDLPLMIAGTRYRGEFEDRLERVVREVEANPDVLLFLDEFHTLIGAGAGEGALDAANILKPALARGRVRLIGATTLAEYRKYVEHDGALERRFQPILVRETNREETEEILRGLRPKLEAHHRAEIDADALSLAVGLADRYIAGRFQPDKSIDVIDEAASAARLRAARPPEGLAKLDVDVDALRRKLEAARRAEDVAAAREAIRELARVDARRRRARAKWDALARKAGPVRVTCDDVRATVARMTGVTLANVAGDVASAIGTPDDLERVLTARVFGQERACRAVARAIGRAAAGLKDPRRPVGSFLFVGPSGVGKTLLAKTLAERIFGTEDALVAVDMSELMERHDASKLIGAPPGYVGHDRGAGLAERVRRRPQSVVLFDEVDKAHPDVLNLLLEILEEGRLTDGAGRVVDFRNTVVIMTSNTGTERLFGAGGAFGLGGARAPETDEERLRAGLDEMFKPEILNRLDGIIPFERLSEAALARVLDHELVELRARLGARRNALRVTDGGLEALFAKAGDGDLGARPMRRLVEDWIATPLADMLLRGEVKPGDEIVVRQARKGEGVELEARAPRPAPAAPEAASADASENADGDPDREPGAAVEVLS